MEDVRYFEGAVKDGKIYERKYKDQQQIGVTLDVYDDLHSAHEELAASYKEYQALLIERGIIKAPMSPEEQIAKLTDINERQSENIAALSAKVEELMEAFRNPPHVASSGKSLIVSP